MLLEFMGLMVPLGETFIGLEFAVGAAVRLAAAGDAFLVTFFCLDNAEWGHGLVNGDLLGSMMFLVTDALAMGCTSGFDACLRGTEFIRQ